MLIHIIEFDGSEYNREATTTEFNKVKTDSAIKYTTDMIPIIDYSHGLLSRLAKLEVQNKLYSFTSTELLDILESLNVISNLTDNVFALDLISELKKIINDKLSND